MTSTVTFDDLAADLLVCQVLGKRPGESIRDRAEYLLEHPHEIEHGHAIRILRACRVLVTDDVGGWPALHRAARILAHVAARAGAAS